MYHPTSMGEAEKALGGDIIVPSPSSGGGDDINTSPVEGDTFM